LFEFCLYTLNLNSICFFLRGFIARSLPGRVEVSENYTCTMYRMGCTEWDVPNGMYQMGCTRWDVPDGMYQMGCTRWDVPDGMLGCRTSILTSKYNLQICLSYYDKNTIEQYYIETKIPYNLYQNL